MQNKKAKETNNRINSPNLEKINARDINFNYNNNDQKNITYEGSKNEPNLSSSMSPYLIQKYGEKKITISGFISLIVGLIQLGIWAYSLSNLKVSDFLTSISERIPIITLILSIIFILLGIFLLGAVAYYHYSRCKKCKQNYAYQEYKHPTIKETRTHKGTRIMTTRYFKCKFCGDEDKKYEHELVPNEKDTETYY